MAKKKKFKLKSIYFLFFLLVLIIVFCVYLQSLTKRSEVDDNHLLSAKVGNMSIDFPNGWVQEGDYFYDKSRDYKLTILTNDFDKTIAQCGGGCQEKVSIFGTETCLSSAPLCRADQNYMSQQQCEDEDCGAILSADLCVDANGQKSSSHTGCVDLVQKSENYTYYKFLFECRSDSLIKISESECQAVFKNILSTVEFPQADREGWKPFQSDKFTFTYPQDLVLTQTGDQIKIVTKDGLRFMVIRVDHTIQDLEKFVFDKAEAQKRNVSTASLGSDKAYMLYGFLTEGQQRLLHSEYLYDLGGASPNILWIDSYVYESELGEKGLVVDEILKSFSFNR